MFFLKYRRSLRRFANRPGVYKKVRAVEQAVEQAARRLKFNGNTSRKQNSA
jgi:hypothetical protein